MSENKITTLYEHYKNTPKKLKIICDWDEVIQPREFYALWVALETSGEFPKYFKGSCELENRIEYSPYDSELAQPFKGFVDKRKPEIKNSPNFYQQAPFLTIAEDLLKLIKEDKVEKLIFLSAYDKRKFPDGDDRKYSIFYSTFGWWKKMKKPEPTNAEIELIPFESETQGQTKADWIKQNASDFDIFIDDNPNICKSVIEEVNAKCLNCLAKESGHSSSGVCFCDEIPKEKRINLTVLAPHYPATANQHDERVLLVKNEVSELKKEDFK
jgi:hypothetical protein